MTTNSAQAISRLQKDYAKMQREEPGNIKAKPLPENMLEWHYVIIGSEGTPYFGGVYHGRVVFPPEFPFKPPSLYMITPSGRFNPNTRICMTMSDYHPETWNPGWTVSAILMGLLSFMNDSDHAEGCVTTSEATKRELAKQSVGTCLASTQFCALFPELVPQLRAEIIAE